MQRQSFFLKALTCALLLYLLILPYFAGLLSANFDLSTCTACTFTNSLNSFCLCDQYDIKEKKALACCLRCVNALPCRAGVVCFSSLSLLSSSVTSALCLFSQLSGCSDKTDEAASWMPWVRLGWTYCDKPLLTLFVSKSDMNWAGQNSSLKSSVVMLSYLILQSSQE